MAQSSQHRVLVKVRALRGRPLRPFLQRTALGQLRALALPHSELSISLVGDRGIRTLNREWRGKDLPTDVLSFPQEGPPQPTGLRALGDVVLSLDTAERAARERGISVRAELARYLAHGLLHLLGYDHQRPGPRRRMAALEERLLGTPGLIPPTEGHTRP
jgi:probable rRNA maturation factor